MQPVPASPIAPRRDRRARRLLLAAALGAVVAGPAQAQLFVWSASTPKFWDDLDGQDWIDGQDQTPVPAPFGGQGAFAFINNGGTATIRQNIGNIQDIIVGDTDLRTSTLVHTAGSTQVPLGTPGSMIIGRNGAAGTYLMSGSATQAKQLMLIGTADSNTVPGGEGMLDMSDSARFIGSRLGIGISGDIGNRSVGFVSMVDQATIQTSDWVRLHNGMMEVDGAANGTIGTDLYVGWGQNTEAILVMGGKSHFEVAGNVLIGSNDGEGSLVLGGSARLEKIGGNGYIGLGTSSNLGGGEISISDKAQLVSDTNLVVGEFGRNSSVQQLGGYVEFWDNPNQVNGHKDAIVIDPTGDANGRYHLAGGTLKVQSIDARTGPFDFTGGRLMISKTFRGDLTQTGGVLAPGASPGEVTIEGDYNLNADEEAGVLEIELGGTVPVAEHDKITILGDVNLASGILRVLLYEGFAPAVGNSFDFMDWTGSLSGKFTGMELPDLGAGKGWNTAMLLTDGVLSVMLPGDTNGDGDVDDSDLGTLFSNYTGPVGAAGGKTAMTGDTDNDGDVDDSDLGTAFANYTGPLAPATVPEPATLTLLLAGALGVMRRRR